jgi:hypothetical protein
MHTTRVFGTAKCVLFMAIRECPDKGFHYTYAYTLCTCTRVYTCILKIYFVCLCGLYVSSEAYQSPNSQSVDTSSNVPLKQTYIQVALDTDSSHSSVPYIPHYILP